MITFTQFSERLARAELKNMSAVDQTNLGEVQPDYIPTILSLTNEGLRTISTKFPLFKLMIDFTLQEGKQDYSFDSDSGLMTNVPPQDPLVYDPDRFVKILNVYDSNGDDVLVDVNGHVTTTSYNSIHFTTAKLKELMPKVRVRYHARHEEIDEDSVILLPPNLETALQLLVASLYIGQMNGQEHSAKGDSYYAAYLRLVGEDEMRNTSSISEVQTDDRFSSKGFV